jgi:hypothetical protein
VAATLFNKARGLFGLQKPAATAEPTPVKKKIAAHHAVSVVTGPRCCAEAKALRGQKFLSRQAPALPLKDCNRDDCTCRYEHYEDRRATPRRARDMGVAVDGWVEEDRRGSVKRGRRTVDR